MDHHLIWQIIAGILIGWLAGVLVEGKGMGILTDLIVGILGALLGGFGAEKLGIHPANFLGALGIAVAGAVVLLVILRMIKSK